MKNRTRNALFVIDAQVDFCDSNGALFVTGADEAMKRAAKMIRNNFDKIDAIKLTQDTHHPKDIAHQIWWKDKDGNHPPLFSVITSADVFTTWIPQVDPMGTKSYIEELEKNGEYAHVIWPNHCIAGTTGWTFYMPFFEAVLEWEAHAGGSWYEIYQKGEVPFSEHFGALRANVQLPNFPSTGINYNLLNDIQTYNRVYLLGQAKSHCVANTLKQIMDETPELLTKLYIVEDAMNDVTGFEGLGDPVFDRARQLGATFVTTINPQFLN